MKLINIHLVKPIAKKIISEAIMFCEGTKYSHIVISWYIASLDRTIYYEATGSGVNFLSQYNFINKYKIVKTYEFEVNDLTCVARYCHDNSGNSYAFKQLIGLGIMRLAKMINIIMPNPYKDGKYSQICLELGARILAAAGTLSLPENIEDYGLIEFEQLLNQYGKLVYG